MKKEEKTVNGFLVEKATCSVSVSVEDEIAILELNPKIETSKTERDDQVKC